MRRIPFGRPMIGREERDAVSKVLSGNILVHGPRAKEFEKNFAAFTKAPNAISVSSCTAALHLAYFYLGIGKGDEVIVPAQTHAATAHAIEFCGAKPVFIDSEKETGNIDIDWIESCINGHTKAISIVHFLGMPVDMDLIVEIAGRHRLFIVEDCALSIGTYFKGVHAGLRGDIGCFSFYPVKHMTTAEGGMLITKSREIAKKIEKLKAFGVDKDVGKRKIPGIYDVTMLGYNYRMNEIEAAMGIEQLKRMDNFLRKRKRNYEILSAGLKEIDEISQFKTSHGDYQSGYYCLSILLDKPLAQRRLEIIAHLKEDGIGTSIYYPKPVPHMSYYKDKYGYSTDSYPVARWISDSSIALPCGPHLNKGDIDYIIESVKKAIEEIKK